MILKICLITYIMKHIKKSSNNDQSDNSVTLDQLFRLQHEYVDGMNIPRYPKKLDSRISLLCTAIIHEAIELQRLTSWKWWKKESKFDVVSAKEELIDIWHFVIQASIELNMDPIDILQEYSKKNKINRDRQKSGY